MTLKFFIRGRKCRNRLFPLKIAELTVSLAVHDHKSITHASFTCDTFVYFAFKNPSQRDLRRIDSVRPERADGYQCFRDDPRRERC